MIPYPARGARRFARHVTFLALLATAGLLGPVGCSPNAPVPPLVASDGQISPDALVIPANVPWVDTGINVVAGEPLTIAAKGRVAIAKLKRPKLDAQREVGPKGTFFYGNKLTEEQFPLPAA